MDKLFERNISTWIQDHSCNKCLQQLNICIAFTNSSAGSRKELCVRVTNPNDAFMLYSLKINEDDYHNLRNQQGLLIDFPSFPTKFIELLKMCEDTKEKFELHLHTQSSTATLQVVEVNPFKHLVHLALNLSTATDTVIKKYLAECLNDLQKRHDDLKSKNENNEVSYHKKINELESTLQELRSKLQGAETAKDLELSEQSAMLKEQIQTQREAAHKYQQQLQEKSESTTQQLDNRIKELETKCKKIFDEKCRFELQNRELIAKVKFNEEERASEKEEIKRVKKEKSESEREVQKLTREVHNLSTQLAVTQQDLKDKHNNISNLQEQLSVSNTQKSKLETQIDTQHYQCLKLENTVRSVSEEVVKGNEIISKMQNEIKNYRSKIKIKQMQNAQQEKTIQEQDGSLCKLKKQLSSVEEECTIKTTMVEKLTAETENMSTQIEEFQKTLKSNENVISWLNKQINDKVTMGVGPRSLPSLLRNAGSYNQQPAQQYVTNNNRYVPGKPEPLATSSTPTLTNKQQYHKNNMSHGDTPEYHHLSSFTHNTNLSNKHTKEDSLIDEAYLKSENMPAADHVLIEDSLPNNKSRDKIMETPESQVITIGRNKKVLQQKQNTKRSPNHSQKRDVPPLMKVYAP